MKPLRLQIVVQPRPTPSVPASALASTASEPIVKWLEICYADPTIQELCDTLETRFFQRNHVPLNIKILKYGDDFDLFPEFKVRDIFHDINDPVASCDKSKCTVKVYRNPPTSAELADPQRFESLPPNSFARPRKRPLPSNFSTAVRGGYQEQVDHGHPLRPVSPVQRFRNDKRQKVEALDPHLYFNPDRPLDSLESRNGYFNPLPIASQRPSPGRHADGNQKRKRESFKLWKWNMSTEVFKGSDPYGTPVSSQTVPQGLDKPQETEIISVPDSPISGNDPFDHGSSHFSSNHHPAKPKSPELPIIASRSSKLGAASPDMQSPIFPPPTKQGPQIEDTTIASEPLMSRQATTILPLVSQELANDEPTGKSPSGNALKTPSPKSKDTANQSGQLQRPKSAKNSPAPKRVRKVINGVRQKTPSIFDPIESSEGSTYEREQLRSTKRLKLPGPPQQAPKSMEQQENKTHSISPGGQFLLPNAQQPHIAAGRVAEAPDDHVPLKSYQDPEASPRERTHSDNAAMLAKQPAPFKTTGRANDTPNISQDLPDTEACGKALENNAENRRSPSRQSFEHDRLERQINEEEQVKQKAQADFDRIAAMRSEKKSARVRTKADPAASEDSSANHESTQESRIPVNDLFAGLQAPSGLSLQERREWNLKHLVPVRDKFLKEMKAESQAWKKQERTAQAEAQRQQKQVRAQKLRAAKKPTHIADAEDDEATEKQAEADVADTKERQIAEQQVQDKADKIHKLKSKVGRGQPVQQAKVAKPNLADFPQPTRIKTKQTAQQRVTGSTDTAEGRAKKDDTAVGTEIGVNGVRVSIQGQSQVASGSAGISKKISATERLASAISAQDVKPAATQGVCNSDQSWLFDRSPKAKYNAARQLQLANEWLKQTKRNSTVVPNSPTEAKPTAPLSNSNTLAPAQKVQAGGRDIKKQRSEDHNGAQRRKAAPRTFVDSDALRAAGISVKGSATSTARKGSANQVKPAKRTHVDETTAGRSQLHGILKCAEAKFSSPAPERSESVRNRSMTPAFPSSSKKNSVSSAGAIDMARRRAATLAPDSLESPAQNDLRASTPGLSQRSVSFANDLFSTSQTQNTSAIPTTHASGTKKGMLYRALEESNAKRAEETNGRAKSTATCSTTTVNKATKPPTKAKQTKMTQHLDRDLKGKGKAVVGDRLVYLSSSDEAATYFSDESEGEVGNRAGPSSRKRAKPVVEPTKVDKAASDTRRANARKLANEPQSVSVKVKSKSSGPDAASSDKTSRIRSSSPSSYSDSEVESVLGQTDDVGLLPVVPMSSSTLAGSSQKRNGQKSTVVDKVSSMPELRSSLVPEPSSTPKNRTHDARMARLSEEQRMSEEAARQLRREHMEAVRKASVEKGSSHTSDRTASGQGASSSQRAAKRGANVGYKETSLSKLRQAQAATKAAVAPKPTTSANETRLNRSHSPEESSTSDSDSSSVDTDDVDQIQVTQPKSQGSSTPKKKKMHF
ncbi:MAG: hypothetical protein Q9207_003999, partial [Kuettlingeria erythrocarpa]